MIRILLVDDSEVIRFLLSKSLERDAELRVIAQGSNGIEAIDLARQHQPDIVLLDIEMPQMDGITALPKILEASPKSKVIVVSGATREHAEASLRLLELGARELVLKPGSEGAAPAQQFNEDLRLKIKAIHTNQPPVSPPAPLPQQVVPSTPQPPASSLLRRVLPSSPSTTKTKPRALVIASSTGGPEALQVVFKQLVDELSNIPIFITQHMPPKFTAVLAEHISRYGKRPCREAVDGEEVIAGQTYVAPGGKHLIIRQGSGGKALIRLSDDIPVNSCRPSADPMFASASEFYRQGLLGVVLTGIGQDGLNGARTVVDNGGKVLTQDRETSVVYGMPRAVAEAGIADAILPLGQIGSELLKRFK